MNELFTWDMGLGVGLVAGNQPETQESEQSLGNTEELWSGHLSLWEGLLLLTALEDPCVLFL